MDLVFGDDYPEPLDILARMLRQLQHYPDGTQFLATIVKEPNGKDVPGELGFNFILRLEELEELKEVDPI